MSCFMDHVQFMKIVPKTMRSGINSMIILSDDNAEDDIFKIVPSNLKFYKEKLFEQIEDKTFTAVVTDQETGEVVGQATVFAGQLNSFWIDSAYEKERTEKLRETLFEYVLDSGAVDQIATSIASELSDLCEKYGWVSDSSVVIFTKK